jgi:uncharacterized BrkB/YihY/UPF0761 family membrane protein
MIPISGIVSAAVSVAIWWRLPRHGRWQRDLLLAAAASILAVWAVFTAGFWMGAP